MRLLLTMILVVVCQLANAASAPVPTLIVATESGRVQGLLDQGASAFKGIPYGKPPVGELRFMAREPVEKWVSVLDATDYGASAMQMYNRGGDTDLSRQIATVFTTESEKKSDNEDSLFLNVWTPAPDERKRLAPFVDGDTLPRDPFTPSAPRQSRDIPLLIGWNKDEMTIFNAGAPWFGRLTEDQMKQRLGAMYGEKATDIVAAYQNAYPDYTPTYLFNMIVGDARMALGSVTLADRKASQKAGVFMYYLTWETPVGNGVFKSPHTLDMPLMFNNVDKSIAITGESTEARILENQMSSSWIAFARTGNPSNPTVGTWTPYTAKKRATMIFDVEPQMENDPKGSLLGLLAR